MKSAIVTELVEIRLKETITDEQFIEKADLLNKFISNQDGFIDAEIAKGVENNIWCLIYHYENMEKVNAIGTRLRKSGLFKEINLLTIPDGTKVSFYMQMQKSCGTI